MGVQNPVIFKGEQAFGTTAGAPLSTDANNKVTSGIPTSTVNATANATTTSTTDVAMTTMTLTPVAGTYLVLFSGTFSGNQNNANITFSIYSGGTLVTGTPMVCTPQIQGGVTPSLNMNMPGSTSCYVTVNGSQAIEVRWKVSAGTGTVQTRILNIMRTA